MDMTRFGPAPEEVSLPELPSASHRKLELLLQTLLDKYDLTGEHLRWREESEWSRRRRIEAQSATRGASDAIQGSRRPKFVVGGRKGIAASLAVAEGRFNHLVEEYRSAWRSSGQGYESFVRWLEIIKRLVLIDVASIWTGGSKSVDSWNRKVCRPRVEKALTDLVREETRRAREDELKRQDWAEAPKSATEVLAQTSQSRINLSRTEISPLSEVASGSDPNSSIGTVQGTTEDLEFWRRAEEKFRRLQPTPPQRGEVQRDSHNGLGATWYPWREGDKWALRSASSAIMKFFSDAAESAAVELGHSGGPAAVSYWLDLLKVDSPYCKPLGDGFEIYRLCDASAEYCLNMETKAKVNKRNRGSAIEPSSAHPERLLGAASQKGALPGPNNNGQERIGGAAVNGVVRKTRGRPQTIPDKRKAAALEIRKNGGTLREAAIKIYEKNYPTSQEVKNASTILRHYVGRQPEAQLAKVKQVKSSGSARKTVVE